MRIRYKKITCDDLSLENIKTPVRANPSDAGLDIFYAGTMDIIIESLQNCMVPTRLIFEIPHGYMLEVCNRGSMGAKKSLIVGAHIVDSGYGGEVFIDLHNIGRENQIIKPGDKIAQLVMIPVVSFIPVEVEELVALYDFPVTISERGSNSLGSTGV
jgi:dUTP pyrophosphatase